MRRALFIIVLYLTSVAAEVSAEVSEAVLPNHPILFEQRVSESAQINNMAGGIETIAPEQSEESTRECKLTYRTNLLYWCGGVINGGLEWRPGGGGVGYLLNGGYSPLANQSWERNMGGYFVSPEVRFYMGGLKRGYLGVQALVVGYNYKMSDTGYQGEMYALGVVGGYRAPISKHFDLDFTLGAGAAQFNYGSYRIIYNGMSLYNEYDLERRAWVPIQVGVSLIFGRH